jgi:hypothetical protein
MGKIYNRNDLSATNLSMVRGPEELDKRECKAE